MKRFFVVLVLLMAISFAAEDALRIQNQMTIPVSLQAGDKNVLLQFDLFHTGKVTYANVTVQLNLPQQFEGINTFYSIDRITPGQTVTASFRMNIKPNIDPSTYTIPVTIKYIDTSGPYQTFTERQVYLSISSVPTLRLDDITFLPTPHIGESFDVIFSVNNTAAIPASNVIATISIASTVSVTWIPDYQVVDYIAPNSVTNVTFKGVVSIDNVPGAYPGTVKFLYSNTSLSNNFILEVHGTPDLRLAGTQTDVTPYVGEKFTLSVQLEDIGKEKARSVQAKINDPTIQGTLDSYIGTIESDDTGSAIFDITIPKSGSYIVPVEITYMDDEGNSYTDKENIELYIYTHPFNYTYIVLLVLAAVAIWYWQSRKKKKHRIDKIVD